MSNVRIIIFLLIVFFCLQANAQNNSMEAKAAYLLAEEDFNAGKYESSIKYLDEATVKLGASNAKILYLKIQCLQMLAEKDEKQMTRLKETIEAFEKAPDIESFNEEKQLEVMKLKMKMKKVLDPLTSEKGSSDVFKNFQVDGWRLGVTLDEMQIKKPEFFAKAKRIVSSFDNTQVTYSFINLQNGNSENITFKDGVAFIISVTFLVMNETASFSMGQQALNNYLKLFPSEPKIAVTKQPNKRFEFTTTTYTWNETKLSAFIIYSQQQFNDRLYTSSISVYMNTKQ